MTTIKLTTPISAHGDMIDALTFQPLKAKHLRNSGDPFINLPGGAMKVDYRAVAVLISELAGIPTSSVDQLEAPDWVRCSEAIIEQMTGKPAASA